MSTINKKTYKVGDLYTTTDSNITGTIIEINVVSKDLVRVKLETGDGYIWSTWSND
jgi:small-conductance mechanosensitive channel